MTQLRRLGFRGRLLLFLLAFALIPTTLLGLAWLYSGQWALGLIGNTGAWEAATETGRQAIDAARRAPLDPATQRTLAEHERMLRESLVRSRQAEYVFTQGAAMLGAATLILLALIASLTFSVAGHLSRALSRPLHELVGWTDLIRKGEDLPAGPPRRGAPEFALLRDRMRQMYSELKLGRSRALQAERAEALRESARQVAHELKNPLTPIRFAVDRLRREAPRELADTVEILAAETGRLETMATNFSQFGRLPEGPRAEVDLAELARYSARSVVPPSMDVTLDLAEGVPFVDGHYDALARSLSNVVLNAVDACDHRGSIHIRVASRIHRGREGVEIAVSDNGCGVPAESLSRIWEPYVTTKAGGTGLGLAIVRQTIAAHGGDVQAESETGVGTTIRLILPASGSTPSAPAQAAERTLTS